MSHHFTTAVILGGAWFLAGCATVTTGTTQPINIDSEPQQAECTLSREGLALGTITTPAPLTIKRHASTIHVVCRKPGYEDGRIVMNSRFETASAGNFLLGGVIGVMVDASSGANSRYESNVLVRLTPMSPADQAAAAAAAKASPPAASQPFAMAKPEKPEMTPSAPQTFVGPWKANATLMQDRSAGICARIRTSYSLDLTNDTLTVDTVDGRMFSATVPADGAIKQSFKAPPGLSFQTYSTYEVTGNARTRDLELVNNAVGCRWKLTPEA